MRENLMRLEQSICETLHRIIAPSEGRVEVPQLSETEFGESSPLEINFALWADARGRHGTSPATSFRISTNQLESRRLSQGPSTCWNRIWWIFSAWMVLPSSLPIERRQMQLESKLTICQIVWKIPRTLLYVTEHRELRNVEIHCWAHSSLTWSRSRCIDLTFFFESRYGDVRNGELETIVVNAEKCIFS